MKKWGLIRKKYVAVLTALLLACMCNGCGAEIQETKEILSDLEATYEEATKENAGEKQECTEGKCNAVNGAECPADFDNGCRVNDARYGLNVERINSNGSADKHC